MRGRTSRGPVVIASLAAVAIATLGLSWLLAPPPATETLDEEAQRAGLHWQEGDARRYSLEVDSRVEVGTRRGEAGTTMRQQLDGTLHLEVLEVRPDQVGTRWRLDSASLRLDGQRDRSLDQRLALPFEASLSPEGAVLSTRFPEALREEQPVLEQVLALLQVVVPADAGAEWETLEDRGSGRVRVHSRRQAGEDAAQRSGGRSSGAQRSGGRVHRRLRAFLDPDPSIRIGILDSEATATLSATHSWLDSCRVAETLEIEAPGSFVRSETTVRLRSMDALDLEQAGAARTTLTFARPEAVRAEDGKSSPADTVPLDEAIRTEFAAVVTRLDGAQQVDLEALRTLRRLFQRCPEAMALVPVALKDPAHPTGTRSHLLHSLEQVGTPEAQEALTTVSASSEQAHDDRLRALVALAGCSAASPRTVESLFEHAQDRHDEEARDLSNTATLALGSIASRLADASQEATALRERLVDQLRHAANDEECSVALKALGNIGDPALTETAAAHLQDASPQVRAAAAVALGSMAGDDSAASLVQQLGIERHPAVRLAMAEGLVRLSRVHMPTLSRALELVSVEEDERTRAALATYLGDHLDTFPEAAPVLRALLASDSSDRVRRTVSDRLLAHGTGGG